jgi:chaperonin GroES
MTNPKNPSLLEKIRPTAGHVLIEPQEAAKRTSSGIYLPETASGDKPQQGKILAAGPDEIVDEDVKKTSPAKKGDIVIYKKWGGNEVKIDGKEYLFVKFEDVLAVIS